MNSTAVGATHSGLNRQKNEDFFLMDPPLGLYVLCDGSHGGDGFWAAETTAKQIQLHLQENSGVLKKYQQKPSREIRLEVEKVLEAAILRASQKIVEETESKRRQSGTLTTVEALLVLSECAILAHVGNSRTYWTRDNYCHLLTKDHTHYNEMLESGMWDSDRIDLRHRKQLTRSVGTGTSLIVQMAAVALVPGDLFLMCSDGLSDFVSSGDKTDCKELTDIHLSVAFEDIPQKLIQFALNRKSSDNITAVLVQIQPEAPHTVVRPSKEPPLAKRQIDLLRSAPVFYAIKNSDSDLLKIQSLITPLKVKKGQTLVQQGAAADEMFILIRGRANILLDGEVIAVSKEGDIIGEMGLFNNAPRSATVIISQDAELSVIHKKDFLSMISADKELGLKIALGLIAELSRRLQLGSKNIADLKSGVPA